MIHSRILFLIRLIQTSPSVQENFILSIQRKKGLKGNGSLVNIKPPGGDANAKGECSFECHFNGMPEKIDSATEPVVDTTP